MGRVNDECAENIAKDLIDLSFSISRGVMAKNIFLELSMIINPFGERKYHTGQISIYIYFL